MRKILKYPILIFFIWSACKPPAKKIVLPDLRPHFSAMLNRRDTTLSLDSFYFIGFDTMNEKRAYIHQRFAFLHIMDRINTQLEMESKEKDSFHAVPSADVLERLEYLKGEKSYVGKQIDSFNLLIANADSTTPVGYRAFYKVTVSKKDKFIVNDTIHYSITSKMIIGDWDRNLDKDIDSLAAGKQFHSGGIR